MFSFIFMATAAEREACAVVADPLSPEKAEDDVSGHCRKYSRSQFSACAISHSGIYMFSEGSDRDAHGAFYFSALIAAPPSPTNR